MSIILLAYEKSILKINIFILLVVTITQLKPYHIALFAFNVKHRYDYINCSF